MPTEKVINLPGATKHYTRRTSDRNWLLIDAEGQSVGRLATVISSLLRGKHKPTFTAHDDVGDFVVVINAEKVSLSGKKWDQKTYIRYTGYPGGQRTRTAAEVMARKPFSLMEEAVRGMLPKNTLGRALFRNMHVYVGANHKHEAQQPTAITFND